ncbi:hypothetical protein AX16_001858 [Volvariella volvacea WC 439]|nr:hypothetical protein AX16_001858 [Volvariella volvacea WC 439]
MDFIPQFIVSLGHSSRWHLTSVPLSQSAGDSRLWTITLLSLILAFVIVDVVLRLKTTRSATSINEVVVSPQNGSELVSNLAGKAGHLIKDLNELERYLSIPRRSKQLKLQYRSLSQKSLPPIVQSRTEHVEQAQRARYKDFLRSAGRMGFDVRALHNCRGSPAFLELCERLLTSNHIWRQEREIKRLQVELESKGQAAQEGVFNAFCERLLLANNVWRLQKVMKGFILNEANTYSGIGEVVQSMKQAVAEMKEEMVIGPVKGSVEDLTQEVEEGKRQLLALKQEHQRQLDELNNEWMQDYGAVVRENQKLRLGQEAKLVEQELANELEQALFEKLESSKEDGVPLRFPSSTIPEDEEGVDEDITMVSEISTATCISTGSSVRVRECCKPVTPDNRACSADARLRRHSMPPEVLRGTKAGFPSKPGSMGKKTPVWRP